MINKSLLKILCVCSLIIGLIIGLIPLIPALAWIAIILIMFGVAPFMIIYLKRLKLLDEIDTQKSLIIGMVSGTSAFIGFSVVYFPLAFILNLIFNIQSFIWVKAVFSNFGFLLMMVIITALLCGLMNMFSSFLTAFLYEYINQKNRG